MKNISLEEAVNTILNHVSLIEDTETVSLLDSVDRILARDLCADIDNPPFDRSPVDGYACKAEDLEMASEDSPAVLKVLCEIDAGEYKEVEVHNKEAVRIMTGAAIPDGCDCCIYQEKTDYGEDFVKVYAPMKKWGNYCFKGEDYRKGTVLLKKGIKITHIEAAIAGSMGLTEVPVYRLPKAALIITGDEVVSPGNFLLPAKIYDCNQTFLAARLKMFGVSLTFIEKIKDDPALVADGLLRASKAADFIITTGGVSVGKKDILHDALKLTNAKRIFWKISLKPGMPTLFSVLNNTPVLSLSGNPFGVAVTAEVLLRPLLCKLRRDPSLKLKYENAVLKGTFAKGAPTRRMIRAIYTQGEVRLPDGLHSNGVLGSMAGCNCLIDLPAGTPSVKDGTIVSVLLL